MNVDKSLTLKEQEWKRVMSSSDVEEIHEIIQSVLGRKNAKIKVKEKTNLKKADKATTSKREVAEKFREDLIKKQTPSELKFKAVLKSLNLDYEFQRIFYTNKSFFIADFYIPSKNVIFEIDGGYHKDTKQKSKDAIRSKELKKFVKKVHRISNECVNDETFARSKVLSLINT